MEIHKNIVTNKMHNINYVYSKLYSMHVQIINFLYMYICIIIKSSEFNDIKFPILIIIMGCNLVKYCLRPSSNPWCSEEGHPQ